MIKKEIMSYVIIILLTITVIYLYLLFVKCSNKTFSRWDIVELADRNYTFKELVNILGAPDEINLFKGYAIWIDNNNQKVLKIGLNDEGGKKDIQLIRVSDFYIKHSLNNADIKKVKPCFKQLSNFKFEKKVSCELVGKKSEMHTKKNILYYLCRKYKFCDLLYNLDTK